MERIVNCPFEKDCPIKFNQLDKDMLINKSPIFNIIIEFLLILKKRKIKLTQKGNLPLKTINNIYAKKYLTDEWIENGITKIRTETDWVVIHNVRIVLTLAGFIRKQYNHLLLTKKCELLLNNDNSSEIFYTFLKAFTLKFNWAYNDFYDDEQLGQIGFLYSLFLINKYGNDKRDLKYFTNQYFATFPMFVENNYDSNISMKESAFHTRFIMRFSIWFGFVEEEIIKSEKLLDDKIMIKKTKLLSQILQVK